MGFGVLAVMVLLFFVLVLVWLYGQFVWSFTQWDMANVRLTPFKPLANLIVAGTFLGGTCVGLWCFSGAAWRKPARPSQTAARRKIR
jgi:ABC-type sugar transport system permease subunit